MNDDGGLTLWAIVCWQLLSVGVVLLLAIGFLFLIVMQADRPIRSSTHIKSPPAVNAPRPTSVGLMVHMARGNGSATNTLSKS
jgi:hypothetical protein